ncbi:MAG: hypothetical protein JXR94_14070 [Candidatus Hydrogenedentes bacterium]|nr:hypothetical protein [Candidatus Hydrogenedentota bacterium]
MGWWDDLFKSPVRRKAEQDQKRREALTRGKTALRRERRAIAKRQRQAEDLRRKAVEQEKQGKSVLAKQAVRQFIQIDKETTARSIALSNMEYTLEQVQVKDNYDEFVRGMKVVADIEELAQQSVDPDETRERLADLAQRNQDLIEPWTESMGVDVADVGAQGELSPEEREAYNQVIADAAGEIEGVGRAAGSETASLDQELERKMDEALGKE